MKKKRIILLCVLTVVLITVNVLVVSSVLFDKLLDMTDMTGGAVRFVNMDKNINESMSEEDAKYIKKLFNMKFMYKDYPACGFREDVSISFNDGKYVFYIANDTCGTVYYRNVDKYISLSEKEKEGLYKVLSKYGFKFPCV